MTRASSNTVTPAARASEANVERRSYSRAGVGTPLAATAGAHFRRRKLSMLSTPPSGAGNSHGVSSRAGSASSAASARRVSGTCRRLRAVLPSDTTSLDDTVRATANTPALRLRGARHTTSTDMTGRSASRDLSGTPLAPKSRVCVSAVTHADQMAEDVLVEDHRTRGRYFVRYSIGATARGKDSSGAIAAGSKAVLVAVYRTRVGCRC